MATRSPATTRPTTPTWTRSAPPPPPPPRAAPPGPPRAGCFASSPSRNVTLSQSAFGASSTSATTQDTGTFDRLTLGGAWPARAWTGSEVGGTNGPSGLDKFRQAGGVFTVSGSGDIAPGVFGENAAGERIEDAISVGSFAAVIA